MSIFRKGTIFIGSVAYGYFLKSRVFIITESMIVPFTSAYKTDILIIIYIKQFNSLLFAFVFKENVCYVLETYIIDKMC